MKNKILLCLAVCHFFTASLQCVVIDSDAINSEINHSANQNLVEIVKSSPDLSTFNHLMSKAGMTAFLEEVGPYTIFAPSNEAFSSIPQNTLQDLMKNENKLLLSGLLKNHIVKGTYLSNNLNTNQIKTLGGKTLRINVRGSQITVEDANVIQTDLVGTNGAVQVIDTVLFTP